MIVLSRQLASGKRGFMTILDLIGCRVSTETSTAVLTLACEAEFSGMIVFSRQLESENEGMLPTDFRLPPMMVSF